MKKNLITLYLSIYTPIFAVHPEFPSLTFHNTINTLEAIEHILDQHEKGVFLRFGDGDVNLAIGDHDQYQKSNHVLMLEMREAFAIIGKNVLKGLPIHCKELNTSENGMFPGNHESNYTISTNLLRKVNQFWAEPISDVYSAVALHFTATNHKHACLNFLSKLRQFPIILVGNQHIPLQIRQALFGNCTFIATPATQSYQKIDSIEKLTINAAKEIPDYKIIITSMGCSGRVLQKRLWHQLDDIFLFDFGSLMDALCGWNTRAWIELSHFDAQSFLRELNPPIHILATAALIENQYQERKKEYIEALTLINTFMGKPIIIESCSKQSDTFLNPFAKQIIYTNSNIARLKNKGVNEIISLRAALKYLNLDDNDIIVKITGRYKPNSDAFIHYITNHSYHDIFIKKTTDNQAISGCFAMKFKYLKQMIETIDVINLQRYMVNFEKALYNYSKKFENDGASIAYIDHMDITAPIFGEGARQTVQW